MQTDPQDQKEQADSYTINSEAQYLEINWSSKWKEALSKKRQLSIKNIQTHSTFKTSQYDTLKLIPVLASIHFPLLTQLNLNNSDLVSIQALSKLHAPKLSILFLSSNKLTNGRSLRKLHFPQLRKLHIYNNRLSTADGLNEVYSKQPLCFIELATRPERKYPVHYRKQTQKNQIQNIKPLIKLPPNMKLMIIRHKVGLMKQTVQMMAQKQKNQIIPA